MGDDELRRWVEECLGTRVELARQPLSEATSFACELLTVRAGALERELFFKDYGRCRLAREGDEGAVREVQVYRRLLDPGALGTAAHVGSRLGESGRTWLLLERVRGARLAERGHEHWLAAGAWLARLQAFGATRAGASPPPAYLALHDAVALRATAEEALRAVAAIDASLERRLQEALEGYEESSERLAAEPRTLVHGSFRPENILVQPGVTNRLVAVDWEHAALGSALYDVAFLAAGLSPDKAESLRAAHRRAAAELGVELPAEERVPELLAILRFHKVLRSLGRAGRWSYPRETVEHLIELAGRLGLEAHSARNARVRAVLAQPTAAEPEHPVLSAWRRVSGAGPTPAPVHPERIRGRFFGRKGRVVYRLGALGPGGLALVAKRCKRARAEVEERLYVRWLPALGVSAPRCLGTCVEGEWAWIFLEDVGTTRLDKELPAERALALRWLAELHARGRRLAPGGLPARGVASFHDSLEAARTALGAALARDGCPCDERRLLAGVLDACARANSQWGRLEALCAAMPATLVHGDFSRKNLYVRLAGGEATLLPIDWEYAGWGVPAVDLGCFLRQRATSEDLAAYRRALARHGLHVEETELRRWVTAGRFLRALVSIQWASTSLAFARREKALANLGAYRQALEEAGAELGGGAP